MDQPPQQDLFDIKLTVSGKTYIRKFAILARTLILLSIIISFFHIASTAFWILELRKFDLVRGTDLWIEYTFMPYYIVAYCVLFYPQVYFYWQATKFLKKGVNYNDEESFNKAFRSLFIYAVFGIILLLLSSLSYGFELYRFVKDYLK